MGHRDHSAEQKLADVGKPRIHDFLSAGLHVPDLGNEMGAAVHEWSAWACPLQRIYPSALSEIWFMLSKTQKPRQGSKV